MNSPAHETQQNTSNKRSVRDAIDIMSSLVQKGEFAEAEAVGRSAIFPLSIPKADLLPSKGTLISEGAQAVVYAVEIDVRHVHLPPHNNNNSPTPLTNTIAKEKSNPSQTKEKEEKDDNEENQTILVAVKRVKIRQPQDLIRFRREVALLAQLQHPHIATLLGSRLLPPDYALVLQLEATTVAYELHTRGWRPGWPGGLYIGAQLAEAIAHLHTNGIVHRDIKPANILLSAETMTAKLTDLGIAAHVDELNDDAVNSTKFKPSGGYYKGHMVGTLEYMAPEVLLKQPHSFASDVFALGVVINEIASGVVPYSDCTRDNPLAHTILEMGYGRQDLAVAVAAEGLRPTLFRGNTPHECNDNDTGLGSIHSSSPSPSSAPAAMVRLLKSCWNRLPEKRPTAHEVAIVLKQLSREHPYTMIPHNGGTSSSSVVHGSDGLHGNEDATTTRGDHIIDEKNRFLFDVDAKPPSWILPLLPTPCNTAAGTAAGTTTILRTRAGSFASAGARGEDKMEDRCVILRDVCGIPGVVVTAVFDGHGGPEAAEYLASNLEYHIERQWHAHDNGNAGTTISDNNNTTATTTTTNDDNKVDGGNEGGKKDAMPALSPPGMVLRNALLDADAAFCEQEDKAWAARAARGLVDASSTRDRRRYPGSTATIALLIGNTLTVANIGDSRAVLSSSMHRRAVDLTRDQTTDRADEKERIIGVGSELALCMGTHRVGPSGLSVTRSIGDANAKQHGIIAEAEITQFTLSSSDSFFIIASDGIWDVMSSQAAVDIVHDTVKQPAMCAQRIVLEALTRGTKDNVCAVVVVLDHSCADTDKNNIDTNNNVGNGRNENSGVRPEKVFDSSSMDAKQQVPAVLDERTVVVCSEMMNAVKYTNVDAANRRVAARLAEDEIMDTY